jgi:hypothetical protein
MSDRRRVDAQEVPQLLLEIEASGQSLAAFARERGLETWRLYEARRKAGGGGPRRKRRRVVDLAPVEVRGPIPAGPLELALSSGHLLRIPVGFDEAELRRLLSVLAGC